MRNLLVFILVLLFAVVARADTVLDTFSGGNGSLGPNWNGGYDSGVVPRDCQVVSGTVRAGNVGFSTCWQTWAVNSFSGDQMATVTLTALTDSASGAAEAVLMLRAIGPPDRTGYSIHVNSSAASARTRILRRDAGVTSILAFEASTAWASSDTLKATITGTDPVTITAYRNGTPVLNTTDGTGSGSFTAPLTGTLIGLGAYSQDDLTHAQLDNFTTVDISVPTTAGGIIVITVQ